MTMTLDQTSHRLYRTAAGGVGIHPAVRPERVEHHMASHSLASPVVVLGLAADDYGRSVLSTAARASVERAARATAVALYSAGLDRASGEVARHAHRTVDLSDTVSDALAQAESALLTARAGAEWRTAWRAKLACESLSVACQAFLDGDCAGAMKGAAEADYSAAGDAARESRQAADDILRGLPGLGDAIRAACGASEVTR